MSDPRALTKSDLRAALAELVDVDPEEYAGGSVRCHYCLRSEGLLHLETCPWVEAATILRGDGAIARRRVGEDEDDFEDRLEDDEDVGEPADRAALAAAARDELVSLRDARPPEIDEPLDAPTAWNPDEE